jgi:glycosyltransferase involved in cell wall biosynthesis
LLLRVYFTLFNSINLARITEKEVDMTLVSVIIPTFQRPERLWSALESVATQTYPNREIIVVNNGGVSVENVVRRYKETFLQPIQLMNLTKPIPLGAARNRAIAAAHGEFIALLDDDDRYRPIHLEQVINALRQTPEAALAYDDGLILLDHAANAHDKPQIVATCRLGLPYNKQRFEQDDHILTTSIVMRYTAFAAVGGFDETMDICEDWDFLLKIRTQGTLLYVPGEIGSEYSMRILANDNVSSTFDSNRYAALALLETRYNLPHIVPKTFYDVARDLGCEVIPVENLSEIFLDAP